MENNCRIRQNHRNAGYILLLMLLAVVLMGVFVAFKSQRGYGVKIEAGPELKNPPWNQWQKIRKHLARGGLGTPDSQQPQISEDIGLTAPLFEDEKGRGTLTLVFRPDYTVKGSWQGKFFVDPNRSREFELAVCKIDGYLIPDETYVGVGKRSEPEKIYFLSKGNFILVDYNEELHRTTKLSGSIFVSGWLLPDYTIQQGQAIMTSDEEHFKLFTFSGKAENTMNRLLEALQRK
jgi:hypothetical protein